MIDNIEVGTGIRRPVFTKKVLPSGRGLLRFDKVEDLFFFDDIKNSPNSYPLRYSFNNEGVLSSTYQEYIKNRYTFTNAKKEIYREAMKDIQMDKEFQELIHKSKTDKRKAYKNKFGGSFLPVEYSRGAEKIFSKYEANKKAAVLNMAFQVGTFQGGDYKKGFIKIMKTILMCQAMNIRCNIDMFDSDTSALPNTGYILVNMAKSSEKIDFNKLLIASDISFFNFSLFNGYAAWEPDWQYGIGGFINESNIVKDLSPFYEIIGGNMVRESSNSDDEETSAMINRIIKINWK